MSIIKIPTNYYEQFDADYSLDVPGEGYGGWKIADLEINLDHTAVVVMHAWDWGTKEEYPGWHRAVELAPRAKEICDDVMPGLLKTIRDSNLKLFHVVNDGTYYKNLPGYKKTLEISGSTPKLYETVSSDPVRDNLCKFKREYSLHGSHNATDIARGFANTNFYKTTMPLGEEYIAKNSHQLFHVCKKENVNHLIYTGFAINACLTFSPGGMFEMMHHGLMCSTIRQAVSAVENKESAREQWGKKMALWWVALMFGYVYDLDDFVNAIKLSTNL